MMKRYLCAALLSAAALLAGETGENLLRNPSFEETVPWEESHGRIELVRNWQCILNSGAEKCDISIVRPGFSGENAIRLHTVGDFGFNSVVSERIFPVTAGSEISASVRMKGKGKGYIRIYFFDKDGQRMKNYQMTGKQASENWSLLNTVFAVPEGVSGIRYALETLRDDADVVFDDAMLSVSAGDLLENEELKVRFGRNSEGAVDSFFWKKKSFEFTAPATFMRGAGMLAQMIPAQSPVSEIRNLPFSLTASAPAMREYTACLRSGKLKGLEIRKRYELQPRGVKLAATFRNTGENTLVIDQRIRNLISSGPGVYSWPTPDWITIFRQNGAPLNGLNSVVHDLFRAGWEAKYYTEKECTLLFEFDVRSVRRLYCYFCMEPDFSTIEWYHREFQLKPGEEKTLTASVSVLPGKKEFHHDAAEPVPRFEEVKPIKLPDPPVRAGLPKQFNDFFPFSAGLGNLNQPEMCGLHDGRTGFAERHAILNRRLMRILAENYFNAVVPGRFVYGNILAAQRDEAGRNRIGEMAREFKMKCFLSTLFLHREDVDVEKYMEQKWPEKRKMMNHPELKSFIREYQDVIPLFYTADELLPQNIAVMLRVHQELRAMLPEHILPFPYLHSHRTDMAPYVPFLVGDFYPIKRPSSSGHNPWAVYDEFRRSVQKAAPTGVWFMPQGFATGPGGPYAFPSAGEIRLMLHSAAAAGVKGISWHGFPSGTWPWMMNYSLYRYSMLGGAGQFSPSWPGVVDCARTFATTGALLLKSEVVPLPDSVRIRCGDYQSANKYYQGPAIKCYALKSPGGLIVMAVNQNPEGVESGTLTLPEGKKFDFSGLTAFSDSSVKLDLAPGDAACFYCGNDFRELDAALYNRFKAERARYRILAQRAAGDKIPVADPDQFAGLPPLQAVRKIIAAQQELRERIDSEPLGRVLREMQAMKKSLDDIDFRLACALDLAVTPEMRERTRRHARWIDHPDRNFNQLRSRLAAVFADFYRLSDAIDEGKGSAAVAGELPQLKERLDSTVSAVQQWLDSHPDRDKIDDPYL